MRLTLLTFVHLRRPISARPGVRSSFEGDQASSYLSAVSVIGRHFCWHLLWKEFCRGRLENRDNGAHLLSECCVCSICTCCLRSRHFLCRLLYICGPRPYVKRMNHAGMMRHPESDETSTRPSTRAMWMEKGEKGTRKTSECSFDR